MPDTGSNRWKAARVLVGGQVPATDGVHVDAVRHRSQVLTRRRQVGGLRPGFAVEDLGRRDELLVVLSADDNELVADDRCRRCGPRVRKWRQLFPFASTEARTPCRRIREAVGGTADAPPFRPDTLPRSRDEAGSAAEAVPATVRIGCCSSAPSAASRRGAFRLRSRSRRRVPPTPSSTSQTARPVGSAIRVPAAVCAHPASTIRRPR